MADDRLLDFDRYTMRLADQGEDGSDDGYDDMLDREPDHDRADYDDQQRACRSCGEVAGCAPDCPWSVAGAAAQHAEALQIEIDHAAPVLAAAAVWLTCTPTTAVGSPDDMLAHAVQTWQRRPYAPPAPSVGVAAAARMPLFKYYAPHADGRPNPRPLIIRLDQERDTYEVLDYLGRWAHWCPTASDFARQAELSSAEEIEACIEAWRP